MSGQFTSKRQTETINRKQWLQLGASTLAILFPLAKTLAVGVVVVPAVGMIGSTAKADTAACNALGSSSYVASSNGNFSLNSFQLFNLDNGTGIGFSANVPAGATVRITYAGQTVTLDNSGSSVSRNLSGSITVNESRGFSNSAVIIAVSGLVTGGSVTIDFDCTEPSTGGGNNNANTGSTAAPAVAPVATPVSIVPPVNAQYGAVADSGVEALLTGQQTDPGLGFFGFLIDQNDQRARNAGIADAIEKVKKLARIAIDLQEREMNRLLEKSLDESKRSRRVGPSEEQLAVAAIKKALDAVNQAIDIHRNNFIDDNKEALNDNGTISPDSPKNIALINQFLDDTQRAALIQLQVFFEGAADRIEFVREEFERELSSDGNSSPDGISLVRVPSGIAALEPAERGIEEARGIVNGAVLNSPGASSNYAPFANPSSGERAINDVTGTSSLNTPYKYSAALTPGQGGITGKFALSNPRAKRPWVIFANSSITGLDDNRAGADRRSRVWAFSAGGSIQWNPKTAFGITGGYSQGVVKSKANASKQTGDYFSVTISGDRKLMKSLSLGISAGYTHGENTLAIGGGTGDFGVDVFNASASLSGAFKFQDFTIAPSLSAGISRVNRDGYTDSLGIIVPGSEKTHGNVNFGTSISKTFRFVDGFKSITPSVSLGGGYFFREKFDATLTSGTVAKQLGFGANLATGLDLRMDNGIGLNIGGSYGLFQNDIQIWSLNAKLSKVF